MIKKRRSTESSTPGRADLRCGMCRRGVSSPLAIVASLLAASIIFFSALSRIAEHKGEKKKPKPKTSLKVIQLYILLQGNVTESQRILKGQCARQLSSDLAPKRAAWQDFRPDTVCSKVDKHQTNIHTPLAQPIVISKHT